MKLKISIIVVLALTMLFWAGLAQLATSAPTMVPRGATILKLNKIYPGLALIGGRDDIVRLITPIGTVVHSWEAPEGFILGASVALDNSNILTFMTDQEDRSRALVEVDRDSNIVVEIQEPEGVEFHHDFSVLENGNYLVLCAKMIDRPEISDLTLDDDCLMEIEPDGTVVWEWQTADHFDDFGFSQDVLDGIFADGGDWAHANSAMAIPSDTSHVDPRFAPGNIVISYRFISMVVVVDRVSGDIVWISEETLGQHHAVMLPDSMPGGGNITIFDNGFGDHYGKVSRYWSRAVELDPVTLEVVWEYNAEMSNMAKWHFFSHFISSVQRLPNGNTLIGEGNFGRAFEVTPTGEIVWEYISPYPGPAGRDPDDTVRTNRVYRAIKVPVSWY